MAMRWPDAANGNAVDPADAVACAALLRAGSRSFAAAARLLPRAARADATALYAFCRVADDAVDQSDSPADALAAVRARLDAIYAGAPRADPVDRAMAGVVARHNLPRALPEALVEGLAWDAAGYRYADLAGLRAYAVRVAGSVGLMMTLVMGRRDADTLARACELGVAMQLTNIARDVGEDARAGRCYLPRAWLRESGLPADPVGLTAADERAIASLVARVLAAAERHYAYAEPGIAALPGRCRPAIRAAARIYAAIGDRLAGDDFNAIDGRAVVPAAGKLRAVLSRRPRVPAPVEAPSALEMAELIAAVQASARPRPTTDDARLIRWWQLRRQYIWVIELFGRLAERDALDKPRLSGFYD